MRAQTLLPRLLPFVAEAGLGQPAATARERLAGWDGTMGRERPEPLIYHAWLDALARSLAAAHDLGDSGSLIATIPRPMTLMRILDSPERWCIESASEAKESCRPFVAGAFATAIDDQIGRAHV